MRARTQTYVNSLWIKPTDALSSNFIGITTLHVSGSLSAHHQEFFAVHRRWYNLCSSVTECYQAQDPALGLNIFLRILFKHLHTVYFPPKRRQLPDSLFRSTSREIRIFILRVWKTPSPLYNSQWGRATSDLNVGRHTDSPEGFRGFIQTLQSNIDKVPNTGYLIFLSQNFRYIFLLLSYNSNLQM